MRNTETVSSSFITGTETQFYGALELLRLNEEETVHINNP